MREGFLLEMGLLLLLDSADILLFVSFWVDFFLALQQVVIVNMTDANLFSIELPVLLRLEGWLLEQLFLGTFWFLGLRRHGSSLLLIELCCLVSSLSRLQLFLFRWRLLRRVISGVLGCTRPDSCLLLPFLVIQVFVLLVRIYVWLIIFAIIFAMNVVTSLSKNNLSNRHVVSVQSILRAFGSLLFDFQRCSDLLLHSLQSFEFHHTHHLPLRNPDLAHILLLYAKSLLLP